jgi:tripartite-type tricarboxylate transporter receptor subunit TctC
MSTRRQFSLFSLGLPVSLAGAWSTGHAQSGFPSRPITIVVPFSVGGSTDLVARLIGQQLGPVIGQTAVVDNKTGGGGVIGWGAVARAEPDGYTLMTAEMSFTIAPGLIPKLPFDAKKGFTHIVTAVAVPHVLVVNPDVPAKTLAELIALAKAQPGKMSYGSGGNGTNTHLGSELFKELAGGLNIVHVPYKGAGAVLQDLMSSQVQMLTTSVPTALPYIKSGKLRALVVTSDKRSAALPDVPSAPEAGMPKLDFKFWVGFAGPAGMKPEIVDKLNKAVIAVLNLPDSQKRLAELGFDAIGNTPAQAAKLAADEMDRWAAVVKASNIKAD